MNPQFPKRLSYKKAERWIEQNNPQTDVFARCRFEIEFWDDWYEKSTRRSRRVLAPLCVVVALLNLAAAVSYLFARRYGYAVTDFALAGIWTYLASTWGRMGREVSR